MPYICSHGHVFVHTVKRIQIVDQSITEELYGCPLCNVFNKEYEEYVKPQEDILDTKKAAHDGEVAKLKAEGYVVHEVFSAHCVMKLVAKPQPEKSTVNLADTLTFSIVYAKFNKPKKFLINGHIFSTFEVCKGVYHIEFPVQGETVKLAGITPEDDLAVASAKLEKFLFLHEIPQEA